MPQDFIPRPKQLNESRRTLDPSDPRSCHTTSRFHGSTTVMFEPRRYAQMATHLAMLGATDVEMAEAFGITLATLKYWFAKSWSFNCAVQKGKLEADANVSAALYQRAIGYEHKAEKIFCNGDGKITRADYMEHHPPDVRAQELWLKNRRPEQWRTPAESAPPSQPVTNNVNVSVSIEDATRNYLRLMGPPTALK